MKEQSMTEHSPITVEVFDLPTYTSCYSGG